MAQLTDTTRAALEELLETSLRATPTDWETDRKSTRLNSSH